MAEFISRSPDTAAAEARCTQEGLVGDQGFAVDASLISADVQKQNPSNPDDWAARQIDPDEAPRGQCASNRPDKPRPASKK